MPLTFPTGDLLVSLVYPSKFVFRSLIHFHQIYLIRYHLLGIWGLLQIIFYGYSFLGADQARLSCLLCSVVYMIFRVLNAPFIVRRMGMSVHRGNISRLVFCFLQLMVRWSFSYLTHLSVNVQLYFENTLTSAVGEALCSSSHHENLYGDVFVKKLKTVTFFARFLFVLRITACIFVSWSSRNVEVFSVGDSKHYSDFIVIRFRGGKDLDIHVKRLHFFTASFEDSSKYACPLTTMGGILQFSPTCFKWMYLLCQVEDLLSYPSQLPCP